MVSKGNKVNRIMSLWVDAILLLLLCLLVSIPVIMAGRNLKTNTKELCQIQVPLIIDGEPSKGYVVINFDPGLEITKDHRIYVTFEPTE